MRPLFALLLVASAAAAAPPRFVAPGLRVTNLKASLAQDFTDHLAQQLVRRGLSVISSSDMQAILGIERQRQLLGCSDDASSCMAELAGALGADGVVTGTVVRVGKRYQVNVRIIDARNARPLALYSEQAGREDDLFAVLDLAAQALVNELQPYLATRAKQDKAAAAPAMASDIPEEPPALVRTRPGARRLWWLPAASAIDSRRGRASPPPGRIAGVATPFTPCRQPVNAGFRAGHRLIAPRVARVGRLRPRGDLDDDRAHRERCLRSRPRRRGTE